MTVPSRNIFSPIDSELIEQLDRLVFSHQGLQDCLAAAYSKVQLALIDEENSLPYACHEVPIEPFKEQLPVHLRKHVNLCRIFLLRRGTKLSEPERHRNSIQRLVSFRNIGAIHIAADQSKPLNFATHKLGTHSREISEDMSNRWNIVPADTWHYPEASDAGDWCTITFHSAGATDIIDEDWRE